MSRWSLLVPTLISLVAGTACSSREVTELTPEMADVVEANNAFAVDLYRTLGEESEDNLFFSPFSISAALAMTQVGAAGQTSDEMAAVLHMGPDEASFHENFGLLMNDLGGTHLGRPYQLHIANRIFGQEGLTWEEPFLDVVKGSYDAPVKDVDFAGSPEQARNTINNWASNQTRGAIPEVLPPGLITSQTRMALANAIYFKAKWASQFDKKDTQDQPFTLLDGSTVTVPLMHTDMDVRVGGDEDLLVAALPYKGDEVSMVVVMPLAHDGLPALEASLTQEQLDGWMDGLVSRDEERVTLPRFEMRNPFMLAESLSSLGMPSAFGAGADFSGLTQDASLVIEEVVHEAFIRVDEEGTTAVAVTVVITNETAFIEPKPVVVDRPFLYLIRDDLTGSILFMGRMTDPSHAQISD